MLSFNKESYPSFFKTFYPQVAVWIAENNNYTETIYVTEKGAKHDWFGAKKRPSAMPVWYGVKQMK